MQQTTSTSKKKSEKIVDDDASSCEDDDDDESESEEQEEEKLPVVIVKSKCKIFFFNQRIELLGSKQKDPISKSPSATSINRTVNTLPKSVEPKRKRRDRIPERPNHRFDVFSSVPVLILVHFLVALIYGVLLKIV